jgi:hypothetical protein
MATKIYKSGLECGMTMTLSKKDTNYRPRSQFTRVSHYSPPWDIDYLSLPNTLYFSSGSVKRLCPDIPISMKYLYFVKLFLPWMCMKYLPLGNVEWPWHSPKKTPTIVHGHSLREYPTIRPLETYWIALWLESWDPLPVIRIWR